MPSYKLTYFDIAGFGEPIRHLLSILGEDFEDKRISKEEWPAIKPTTPFGKVPILEVDGEVLTQSTAICRYLGNKANLAGNDDWENLQIDMAIDTYLDMRQVMRQFFYEMDETAKAKRLEDLKKETFPFYFQKFDELIKKNGGYLANGKLSWGDIFFISSVCDVKNFGLFDYSEKFENITALENKVLSVPQIKKWNESHSKK